MQSYHWKDFVLAFKVLILHKLLYCNTLAGHHAYYAYYAHCIVFFFIKKNISFQNQLGFDLTQILRTSMLSMLIFVVIDRVNCVTLMMMMMNGWWSGIVKLAKPSFSNAQKPCISNFFKCRLYLSHLGGGDDDEKLLKCSQALHFNLLCSMLPG